MHNRIDIPMVSNYFQLLDAKLRIHFLLLTGKVSFTKRHNNIPPPKHNIHISLEYRRENNHRPKQDQIADGIKIETQFCPRQIHLGCHLRRATRLWKLRSSLH